jgi:hypothetical protein
MTTNANKSNKWSVPGSSILEFQVACCDAYHIVASDSPPETYLREVESRIIYEVTFGLLPREALDDHSWLLPSIRDDGHDRWMMILICGCGSCASSFLDIGAARSRRRQEERRLYNEDKEMKAMQWLAEDRAAHLFYGMEKTHPWKSDPDTFEQDCEMFDAAWQELCGTRDGRALAVRTVEDNHPLGVDRDTSEVSKHRRLAYTAAFEKAFRDEYDWLSVS